MKPITLTLSGILIILKVFGQEYFQQEVNYRIEVELDDRKHELTGQETITYINNSPDTLTFLYFHLWPNAYKNRHTALTKQQVKVRNKKLYMASEQDRGYIDNLDFDVDGKKINLIYDPVYNDICRLILYDPLPPGRKIVISTPFRVKIPSADFSRLGHSGNSYQVTQWYPKPAVYDNEGWHRMPYLDMGEFYSEFGSFDVSITLPGNYVVAATGNCRTASETKWLDSLARVTAAIEKFDRRNDMFPPSSERKKTLRYTEQNIHDFAWFADKRFHVLKGEVEVPHSGKKVTTWAMFTNSKARYWQRALEYINDAVYYYSLWSGDYPYANCTAVDAPLSAGGGMEYPTITVIGKSDSHLALEQVIMHEVGHNWFYGVLGSDERTHPWMDEGINTFYEHRYIKTKYPETKAGTGLLPDELISFLGLRDLPPEAVYELGYVINARRNLDQPSTLASEEYSAMNYFTTVYMKTAFLFDYLKEYLGEQEFDRIMQIYFNTWKFKHPKPADLRNIFAENCQKNLDWFFDALLRDAKVPDYSINSVSRCKEDTSCMELTIENKGTAEIPFTIWAEKNNEMTGKKWYEGFSGKQKVRFQANEAERLVIDASYNIPDINRKNNSIRTHGIFRKRKPVQMKFLLGYEQPDRSQIFYTPVVGWNNYDKFMFGVLFYNSLLPNKALEYRVMPMFSTGNTGLAGSGQLSYTLYTRSAPFRYISFSTFASQYSFGGEQKALFQKYKGEINFVLRKNHIKNSADNRIVFSMVSATDLMNEPRHEMFCNIQYRCTDMRLVNPFSIITAVQGRYEFAKAWVEAKYKYSYRNPAKGLNVRIFAGKFLFSAQQYYGNYNFRLSGWKGSQDYQFENIFFGRTEDIVASPENILSRQFVMSDGGFAVYSYLGQTNDWLGSVNITTGIPGKIPVRMYAGLASWAETWKSDDYSRFMFEFGIELYIIKDIFAVYFPVIMSKDLKDASDFITDGYMQKIRFVLNINKLDPFPYAKDIIL